MTNCPSESGQQESQLAGSVRPPCSPASFPSPGKVAHPQSKSDPSALCFPSTRWCKTGHHSAGRGGAEWLFLEADEAHSESLLVGIEFKFDRDISLEVWTGSLRSRGSTGDAQAAQGKNSILDAMDHLKSGLWVFEDY